MTGTGNELAVREGVVITPAERAATATALADAGSIDSWLVVMKDVVLLAEHICNTSFVPKAYRGDAPAVAAAILAGRELGLQPMTALRHVQVVEGSPSLSAEYKRARVLSAGHRLDIEERTSETCTVTGHRQGHKSVTVTYTIRDARTAGLVKDRGAYMTRPRRMLFARACTEVCDSLFTDLTNGLPTAELLEEENDGVNGYDEQPVQPQRQRVTAADARARSPQTVTATVVTPEPSPAGTEATPHSAPSAAPSADVPPAGEAPRKPQQATTGQVGMIRKRFAELYPGEETPGGRAQRLIQTALLAGLEIDTLGTTIGSTKELTSEQATRVLDALKKVNSAKALEVLIGSGEVPGE
jgi:hypothetical protein